MLLVGVSDAAVRPVRGDDQIVIGPVVQVGAALLIEMERDSELTRPFLLYAEQPFAADAE